MKSMMNYRYMVMVIAVSFALPAAVSLVVENQDKDSKRSPASATNSASGSEVPAAETLGVAEASDSPVSDEHLMEPTALSSSYIQLQKPKSRVFLIPLAGGGVSNMEMSGQEQEANLSDSEIKYRPGVVAGALAEFGRSGITFQTGLIYLTEGARRDVKQGHETKYAESVNSRTYTDQRLEYLGLPLFAKYNSNHSDTTRFTLKLGAMPAVLLKADTLTQSQAKYASEAGVETAGSSSLSDSKEGLRTVNLIGQLGAGFQVPMGRISDFRFELLYSRGLLPVAEQESPVKTYTSSIMATLGMGFGL